MLHEPAVPQTRILPGALESSKKSGILPGTGYYSTGHQRFKNGGPPIVVVESTLVR